MVVKASGVTGPVHGRVQDRYHLAGLLDGGDERDQPPVEPQAGELDQQGVAHRLRADAGAVGEEEDRHGRRMRHRIEACIVFAHQPSPPTVSTSFHWSDRLS